MTQEPVGRRVISLVVCLHARQSFFRLSPRQRYGNKRGDQRQENAPERAHRRTQSVHGLAILASHSCAVIAQNLQTYGVISDGPREPLSGISTQKSSRFLRLGQT